jgi:biotin transport system substrate-specific component
MTAAVNNTTLAKTLLGNSYDVIRAIGLAIAGSLAIWISAKIQIPFYPVPLTMQTFVVLLLCMAYGWRLGAATMLLYLAEGAVGFPVFAGTPEKGIGIAYMMGPTGGYLAGYVLAAAAIGWLAERGWDRNFFSTAAAMLVGNVLIYVPGLLWLGYVLGFDKPILEWGMTPFLLGDGLKLLLAASLLPAIWSIVNKSAAK